MASSVKKHLNRCPNCDSTHLRDENITDRFDYKLEDGTSMEIEAADVPVQICENCGEQFLGANAARIQHAAVCRALKLLTPEEIRTIRENLGLTQPEFALLTGIAEATISQWEAGRILHNRAMDRYLRLLAANKDNVRILGSVVENWTAASGSVA